MLHSTPPLSPSLPPYGAIVHSINRTLLMAQALIVKDGARVMSLTDGTSKMSKSDPVEGSRINLTDSPDVINKKASDQPLPSFTLTLFGLSY